MKKKHRTVFYGVITFKDFFNGLCVEIPEIGLCAIPNSRNIQSYFDDNLNESYTLQHGDLVEIIFHHETKNLAIALSYPGQFAQVADYICAHAQNIELSYEDAWIFTQTRTEIFEESKIGDTIYFIEHGGKNGVAYKGVFTTATITQLSEDRISFQFSFPENITMQDFLSKYRKLEQATVWN